MEKYGNLLYNILGAINVILITWALLKHDAFALTLFVLVSIAIISLGFIQLKNDIF